MSVQSEERNIRPPTAWAALLKARLLSHAWLNWTYVVYRHRFIMPIDFGEDFRVAERAQNLVVAGVVKIVHRLSAARGDDIILYTLPRYSLEIKYPKTI